MALKLIHEQQLLEFGCISAQTKPRHRFACIDRPEVVANSIQLRRHILVDSLTARSE